MGYSQDGTFYQVIDEEGQTKTFDQRLEEAWEVWRKMRAAGYPPQPIICAVRHIPTGAQTLAVMPLKVYRAAQPSGVRGEFAFSPLLDESLPEDHRSN